MLDQSQTTEQSRIKYIEISGGDPLPGEGQWEELVALARTAPGERTQEMAERMRAFSDQVDLSLLKRIYREVVSLDVDAFNEQARVREQAHELRASERLSQSYELVILHGISEQDWNVAIGEKSSIESLNRSELGNGDSQTAKIRELLIRAKVHAGLNKFDIEKLANYTLNAKAPAKQDRLGRILDQLEVVWDSAEPWQQGKNSEHGMPDALDQAEFKQVLKQRKQEFQQAVEKNVSYSDTTIEHLDAYSFIPVGQYPEAQWKAALGDPQGDSRSNRELYAVFGMGIDEARDLLHKAQLCGGLIEEDRRELRSLYQNFGQSFSAGNSILSRILSDLRILSSW